MKEDLEYMIQRFCMCNSVHTKLRYKNIVNQMMLIDIYDRC